MNKILYIILAGTLTLGACQKNFLERLPENEVPAEEFWKNEQHVYLAVNGIYAALPGASYHDEGTSDIAHAQYGHESTATAVSSGVVPTTVDVGWNFATIRQANYFLDNVDKAVMDESLKERYKAEVRFMRALFYMNLTNKFGDVPLITKELTLEESNLPRTAKAEVVKFVLDELDAVSDILPKTYAGSKGDERGRITKGAAIALKARFQLQLGNWEEAVIATKDVMGLGYQLFRVTEELEIDKKDDYSPFVDFKDEADEKRFRLALRSFEGLFHSVNESNVEVILDRQYMRELHAHTTNTFLLDASVGGWSSVTPTQNLVNAFQSYITGENVVVPTNVDRASNYKNNKEAFLAEFRNRDPRFYATISSENTPWNALTSDGGFKYKWVPGGTDMSKTGYNFRKFVDPKARFDNVANYANAILIRYAEVLLTFAEAQNEIAGPSVAVYDAIDDVRERAGMPKVDRAKYNSQAELRKLIRNERLVELAGEGLRYVDIRRWGIASDVMKTIYDINNTVAQTRVWDNKLMLMPVPQKEIDNSHGVLKQNPGYQ